MVHGQEELEEGGNNHGGAVNTNVVPGDITNQDNAIAVGADAQNNEGDNEDDIDAGVDVHSDDHGSYADDEIGDLLGVIDAEGHFQFNTEFEPTAASSCPLICPHRDIGEFSKYF